MDLDDQVFFRQHEVTLYAGIDNHQWKELNEIIYIFVKSKVNEVDIHEKNQNTQKCMPLILFYQVNFKHANVTTTLKRRQNPIQTSIDQFIN